MGWTLASEIAAGALIGWGLDWLFGTGRTLLIVGTIAGVLVGMVAFIRSAMQANRQAVEQAGPQTRRTVEDETEPTESHDPE